jgi:Flp pilus assembly protein protease CpaA
MEWLYGTTSIASIQIPNWLIVLGAAVIVILLITSMR